MRKPTEKEIKELEESTCNHGLDWRIVEAEELVNYGTTCGNIPEKSSCIDKKIAKLIEKIAEKIYVGILNNEIQSMIIVPKKGASEHTAGKIAELIDKNGGILEYQGPYKGRWYFESE